MSELSGFLSPVVGAFADPIDGNPTVLMMEAAFTAAGMNWRYLNCLVRRGSLLPAVNGAVAMGWRGFNLSMPHKRAVVQLLTDLSPSSRLTGAVNFVSIGSDGSIFGDNTDGEGFARSVESVSPLRGRSVMIFGSGGAARAIAASAGQRGVRAVYVCARDQLDAAAVARLAVESGAGDAQLVMWSDLVVIPAAIDVLVNATSVGMLSRREVIPIDPHSLRPNIVVCDVVISAERTRLVSTAQDCGCVALDGSGMLVQQAALNFQLWTGQTPDVTAMSRVLNVALGSG